MKHLIRILLFAVAVYFLMQCKTDHKPKTAQEPTKPKLTEIENTQDAANAIITASATFANADCQGDSTCQSIQAPAAVLASADPAQLATVLTPDNIAQATSDVQNLSNNATDTNTNSNTNTNTNTGIQTRTTSQGSASMKYSGISLMSLGGVVLIFGVLFAVTGRKPNIQESHVSQVSSAPPAPVIQHNYVSLEELVKKLNEGSHKVNIVYLRDQIKAVDELVSKQFGGYFSLVEFQESLRKLQEEAGKGHQRLEFQYAVAQAIKNLDVSLGDDGTKNSVVRELYNHVSVSTFQNVGTVKMEKIEAVALERQAIEAEYRQKLIAAAEKKANQKVFTKTGKAGVAAGVIGAVVTAVGGSLYGASGMGLAETSTDKPLPVYFTTLGQIAQQL